MPSIPKDLIDQFVTGPMSAEAVETIYLAFKKALIERALGAELSHHLGYRPGADKPADSSNHRNGASAKTVLTGDGPMRIEVPRDREGSFEPLLIANHERRFTGLAKATVRCHRDKLWTLGGELIRSRYDDEELADKDVKGACDSSSKAMVDR